MLESQAAPSKDGADTCRETQDERLWYKQSYADNDWLPKC